MSLRVPAGTRRIKAKAGPVGIGRRNAWVLTTARPLKNTYLHHLIFFAGVQFAVSDCKSVRGLLAEF
jgi:hypothetical protein